MRPVEGWSPVGLRKPKRTEPLSDPRPSPLTPGTKPDSRLVRGCCSRPWEDLANTFTGPLGGTALAPGPTVSLRTLTLTLTQLCSHSARPGETPALLERV